MWTTDAGLSLDVFQTHSRIGCGTVDRSPPSKLAGSPRHSSPRYSERLDPSTAGAYHGVMRIARWLALGLFLAAAVSRPGSIAAGQPAIAPPEPSTIAAPERAIIAPPTLSIVAPPGLEPDARGLTRLDTHKLVTVIQLVGLRDAGPPIVVMLAAEDSAVAQRTPPWVAGFADGETGTIVIFPARTPPYPYDSMEALLHHEVAHVLISRAAPQADIPRWFHEGLAMALERTWGLRDRSELALAVIGGRRSIAAIDADFRGSATSAARAYGVAGAFVRDLIGRHGRDFPARILAALASGAPFDAAFSASTAMSLAEAERRFWRDSWWYRVVPLLSSSFALWLGVVVLAVVANRRRAARRRARHAQWDADDPES